MAKRLPGINLLRPGWPDEARAIVQTPVFRELLERHPPAGRCLNAGSGEGLFATFLNDIRALDQIVHVDLTATDLHAFDAGRHRAAIGSLTELPFAAAEFDFVFCTEVLEHIENDEQALREIARVLRPAGLLLLSTPTPPAPNDPAHVREGYTLAELSGKLALAHFEVIAHRFCFHAAMRALLATWRWQYDLTGHRRSFMPRFIVRAFAHVDLALSFGKPWDIVVLARKSNA